MATASLPRKLWEHPNPRGTEMFRFKERVNQTRQLKLQTFSDLYDYSVTKRADFWEDAWKFFNLVHSGSYSKVVDESARMDSIPEWLAGVKINFAENILFSGPKSQQMPGARSTIGKEDSKIAVTEAREGCREVRHVTWRALRQGVGRLAQAMKAAGIQKGDRVAVVASNSVDTLQVFLAVTALGGLFSSSSTDMGVKGVLERLLQVQPKLVFMDDWAVYNEKTVDLRPKMTEISAALEKSANFQSIVAQPRFAEAADISQVPRSVTLENFLSHAKSSTLEFERVAFQDPFLIVYSSGTTGAPKCIVHATGGVLLAGCREGVLHRDLNPQSACLQYTTTGWIMYLASVLSLLAGSRVVLYDGSPFKPDARTLLRFAGEQRLTHLGLSPRYFYELQREKIVPKEVADLSALQSVTSTGMVLSEALFEWFYDVAFPPAVQLANISGGTDIAGCFALENPLTPVYCGGCQGPILGIPVEVYNQAIEGGANIKGERVADGTPGELVATKVFPNMPAMFWGADGAKKYHDAYFGRFDDVWTHGDFVVMHPETKGILFLGRADGVLNPSGVRFGSGEIYGVLERNFPQLSDFICVGQRRPQDADESVMLFLLMKAGEDFTQKLVNDIKTSIRKELSPRHVPKYIFETPEIPVTVNLKKVELPVKHIVSGRKVTPSGTLFNPESLNFYYQFAKVEELDPPKSKL